MTAPRAREQTCPPPPPDVLLPRRGGRPSSKTAWAAGRPAGFARLRGARRSLVGSAGALAAAALLALSGALALPATATAQTNVLVSNVGKSDNGTSGTPSDSVHMAQGFETGSDTDGYDLGSVVLEFGSAPTGTGTVRVTVRQESTLVHPVTGLIYPSPFELYWLANPTALSSGLNEFTAPPGATLKANTTYFVVVAYNTSSGGPGWDRVLLSSGLDADAAMGWDIDDAYQQWASTGWYEEESSDRAFKIQVRGTTAMAAPAVPTAFTAAPGNAEVTLAWDAPASDSGVTRHDFRYKTDGSYPVTWTQIAGSGVGGANEAGYTVPSLTNETEHTFELRAVNAGGGGAAAESDPVTPTPGICDRTQQVQDRIVASVNAIFNVDYDCSEVTVANLAGVNNLSLTNKGITSLQAGDFAGLTGLVRLSLGRNSLTALPSGVFSDLTSMTGLALGDNSLTALPEDLFSGLTNLEQLTLKNNELETLPAGVFSGLRTVASIQLQENELETLPAGVFSGLTALHTIQLQDNTSLGSLPATLFSGLTSLITVDLRNIGLTTPPAGLFSGLTNLNRIDLRANKLETLPANVFSGLTNLRDISLTDNDLRSLPAGLLSGLAALQKIRLAGNKLSALPDGLFSGLTALTFVSLDRNTVEPLPLTVTLEKVGTDQVRAKVLAGAPGAVDFTVTVANGTLAGGVTTLSVAQGSVEGTTAVTVIRTDGTTAAVTADVDLTTQPTFAPGVYVGGSTFVRSTSGLPATILPGTTPVQPLPAPTGFSAEAGDGEVTLSWTDPGSGSDVTHHDYRFRTDGDYGDWIEIDDSGPGETNAAGFTVTADIVNGRAYTFHLRAGGDDGDSPAVEAGRVTPQPLPAPTGFSAEAGDGEVTLSWTDPGSGSDVTHHDYRFRTDGDYGDWIEIDDSGPGETNAAGFTVTADIVNGRAYTFHLRAGGDDGDSPAVEAGRVTPTGLPPRVTSVVVASAPQSGDTYRSYETIVFTVTFSKPVKVTPGRLRLKVGLDNPGGASGNTVEAVFSGLSQSQRPTADTPQARLARHMHFEYKVQLFDRDDDGVRIGANALRLASGAQIRNEVGSDAELDHVALGPQSDHKVDGTADVPMIERIEVVSTPRLSSKGTTNRDTYGEGETIRIEVRFDQPVVVEGEPTFALEVGNPCLAVCEADYESGSGTDTLVFAYLVLEVDIDRNGIAIRGNPIEVVSGDSIRNAADQEAHLSSKGKGTQRGHKVDGSRAAGSHLSVEDAEAHEADGEMEFTVRLEPHGLGIVTVDYATADGSGDTGAVAGEDYTETRGTLRFNSLDTERTVSVPITDDAHEDDGETFTLTLSNPQGAKLRGGDSEATGTIRNSEPQTALTASFEDVPAAHDGTAFTFRVAFSEDIGISFRSLREDAFTVMNGHITGGRRVDDRRDLFEMTVQPDSREAITITLPAGRDCAVSGAICTKGDPRRELTNSPSATVEGPPANQAAAGAPTISGTPQVGEELTASTSGISDADGLENARFAYQWIRGDTDIRGATGSRYTAVAADEGERLKVRVSFTDDAGNAESLTSAATDAVAARPEPLTASFEGIPAEHRGEGGFHFRVAFSEDIGISFKALREDAFAVTGGRVTGGKRVDGRRDLFRMTVRPDSDAAVTITLPAGRECGVSGAICTKSEPRRQLTNSPSARVRGPVGISVADARVEEDDGAVLVFLVTLSRAAGGTLAVDYATSDGSAHAGVDYTAASGRLSFRTGESSKKIKVGVLDDAHDEGEETLTLTLSNASSGRLTDGEATGTIENHDPLPRALLARFGRTAAVHVVEHVEERITAPRAPGFRGRFAGRELRRGMERDIALGFLRQLGGMAGAGSRGTGSMGAGPMGAGPMGAGFGGPMGGARAAGAATLGMPGPAGGGGRSVASAPLGGAAATGGGSGPDGGFDRGRLLRMGLGGGDMLTGSDFAMNRETRGGILSVWSRGAQSRFSGREGALSLGGDVRTTMFGADYATGPLVAGLSLSHSRGLGEYAGVAGGQVASSVTGLYPWLGYKATERVTVWGVAGYGSGGLLLTPEGGPALESGLSMAMAAAGTRGELVAGGASGFELAFKADALWVGTSIDGVDGPAGRLKATDAAVTRFRTGLEGSRAYTLAGRVSFKPSVEVGLRHDGGDAETGAGMDVGGGLVVSDRATGLAVDVRVRTLLVHQAEGFSERGVSLSLSYNPTPSSPLGFRAKVVPSWGGQATSGAEALWGRETMGGMAHGGVAQGDRFDGEVGYGLPVGSRFVGTPRVGFSTSEHGRDYRVGYGLGVLDRENLNVELGVDAQRRESPMLGGTSNGVLGRASLGW